MNYFKDVINIFMGLILIFSSILLIFIITTWDLSMFEGERFLNENTYSFFRLLFIFPFIIALFLRVKLKINLK